MHCTYRVQKKYYCWLVLLCVTMLLCILGWLLKATRGTCVCLPQVGALQIHFIVVYLYCPTNWLYCGVMYWPTNWLHCGSLTNKSYGEDGWLYGWEGIGFVLYVLYCTVTV